MSFTNSTTNYHLPQYISTDIPSYLVDQNGAWSTIDTNLKSVSDIANGADTKATNAGTAASGAQSTANTANTKAEGALSNEADTYNSTETYSVGDHVIYNSILYKCKTDISVPEAFDSAKWDRDTIEAMIDAADSDIADIKEDLGNTSIAGIGDGSVTGAISTLNTNDTNRGTVTLLDTRQASSSTVVSGNTGDLSDYKYIQIVAKADNICDTKIIPVSNIQRLSAINSRGYDFSIFLTSAYQWIGTVGFYTGSSNSYEIATLHAPTPDWTPIFTIYGIK